MTLKHTRESLGLTQEQMAKLLGLSYQHHVSDMERGLRPISRRTALILERISVEKLVVDHCHEKGIVRGLLCNGCNVGLGAFRDSPHILKRAAEFIKATM